MGKVSGAAVVGPAPFAWRAANAPRHNWARPSGNQPVSSTSRDIGPAAPNDPFIYTEKSRRYIYIYTYTNMEVARLFQSFSKFVLRGTTKVQAGRWRRLQLTAINGLAAFALILFALTSPSIAGDLYGAPPGDVNVYLNKLVSAYPRFIAKLDDEFLFSKMARSSPFPIIGSINCLKKCWSTRTSMTCFTFLTREEQCLSSLRRILIPAE